MSESEVEFLNVQADSEFDPGDLVQIVGLDGTVRSLKYTVVEQCQEMPAYTIVRDSCGGKAAVLTYYLRCVGEIR